MGKIYKYDTPFGSGDSSAYYVQGNMINNGLSSGNSAGGVTLDTHLIWGQPFNGKQNVDGNLTITHGDVEIGVGNVHIGSVTDNEGAEGGNLDVDKHTHTHTLEVDEDTTIGGNLDVQGTGYFINDLMTDGRLTVDSGADIYGETFTDSITSFYGSIDAIKSESITTDYLTVLKSATFFEVIIEKLKSIGGSIILSPADGFVCSEVERLNKTIYAKRNIASTGTIVSSQLSSNVLAVCYRLYWVAETTDAGGNTITLDNQWQIGDFMMCQSFGLKQGTTTNAATKYYWCVVVGVGYIEGTDTTPRKNYIEITTLGNQYFFDYAKYSPDSDAVIAIPRISKLTFSDPGSRINPSAGDNIVHLGNAFASNNNRGNAIYTSCVTSRDYGLTPPFIATYKSIDTFDLSGHRHSWISPNGNVLRGQFFAGTDDKAIDELMKEWEKTAQSQIDSLNQGHADQAKVISSLIVSSNAIRQRVTDNENKISQLQIDINGISTKVENYNTNNSTAINQNSESITLLANEIEKIKVTKDKIILNGDTEVNGIVNINQDGTGLKLIGSNGESFTVGSNDIGSYSTFAAKTSERYIAPIYNNKFTFSAVTIDGNKTTTQSFSKQVMLCNLKVGQRINLTNLSVGVTSYDGANAYITNISVYIYRDDPAKNNLVWSAGLSTGSIYGSWEYDSSNNHWGGSKSVLGTYTATTKGDYYVKISGNITGTAPSNTSAGSGTQTIQKISSYAIANFMIYWNRTLDAFGGLTYNGFGFNFGGGNLMFVGNDQTTIQYQGYGGLQITKTEGLKKLVPDTFAYKSEQKSFVNAGKWIGINDKVVRNVSEATAGANKGGHDFVCWADELIVATSIGNSLIMILPLPQDAVGRSVYFCNRSTSDNFFVTGYGSLSETNTTSNQKIIYDGSTTKLANETCTQSSAAGNRVFYGLKKLYRHKWQFTSDGTYWHAQLLS